jgi:hypothetical protein
MDALAQIEAASFCGFLLATKDIADSWIKL